MPTKPKQFDLFGDPIEAPKPTGTEIVPLDFESHAVRMVVIKGEPWWVLADVARVLGYRDAANAGRLLRDKHKGTHLMSTLGGQQKMVVINEPGLYRLIMRSEAEQAERFQDWVTEEVLPQIRKTGSYTGRTDDRLTRTMRRLRSDKTTAVHRLKNTDVNKSLHAILSSEGACPNDYAAVHNAVYRGQTGVDCKTLRRALVLKKHQTPLDHMSGVALSQNWHAKALAERKLRDLGQGLTEEQSLAVIESVAREVVQSDLEILGPGHRIGIEEDPKRGRVLDVLCPQLA